MRDRRPQLLLVALVLLGLGLLLVLGRGRSTAPSPPSEPRQGAADATPRFPPVPDRPPVDPEAPAPEKRWREIRCLLPVETVLAAEAPSVLLDDPWGSPQAVLGDLTGTELRFSGPYDEGAALVTLPGYERAGLIWFTDDEGRTECLFPQDPVAEPRGTLRLAALPARGEGELFLYGGCGINQEASGEVVEVELPAGDCAIKACRVTGPLFACGEPVDVRIVADGVVDAAPLPPDQPVAAAGFEIRDDGDAVVLTTLTRGGPAEAAGLQVGDRILAIDGVDVADIPSSERRQSLVGSVDEPLVLTLQTDEGEETLEVPRVDGNELAY